MTRRPDAAGSNSTLLDFLPLFAAGLVLSAGLAVPAAATGAVMKYMELDDLVETSDVVVRGTVSDMRTVRDGDRGDVFTRVDIEISETYLGEERESVTVEQWGGTYQGRTHQIPGDAQFESGEEVIVFLAENRDDSDGPMYLTGLAQSKFDVLTGERAAGASALVVRDLSGLALVREEDGTPGNEPIDAGNETWTLESFEATLRSLTYTEQQGFEINTETGTKTEGSNE